MACRLCPPLDKPREGAGVPGAPGWENEKPLGDDLLSQAVASQVPSVLAGLTTGFGMGPGVPPPL